MQTITHDAVAGAYAPTADYAHAVELRSAERLLFTAGTMGLDPAGAAGASLDDQLALVWANLRAILAAADMTVDDIVRVTSYLRDRAYAEANARARVAALGGRRVPTTAIVVETLADDWLIELEIVAGQRWPGGPGCLAGVRPEGETR
jgi:enamine deaminase RidA (YjgF/YER057c/UK114 family)